MLYAFHQTNIGSVLLLARQLRSGIWKAKIWSMNLNLKFWPVKVKHHNVYLWLGRMMVPRCSPAIRTIKSECGKLYQLLCQHRF
ncbi:hypothetical protein BLA29_014999, partial [Euroglyphus maynei]